MKRLSILFLLVLLSGCSEPSNEGASSINDHSDAEQSNPNDKKDKEKENDGIKEDKQAADTKEDETEEPTTEAPVTTESKEDGNDSKNKVSSDFTPIDFSQDEKSAMVDEFLDWADERAEIGNMAVTDMYFTHGAGGRGDWYASSPDGDIMTQDLQNPGFDAFDIHAVGGVVWYHRKDGETGERELDSTITATGYSVDADNSKDIVKYILADNGVVYELNKPGSDMSFTTGFGEYADDGSRGDFIPEDKFIVSMDQAAQTKWKEILRDYQ